MFLVGETGRFTGHFVPGAGASGHPVRWDMRDPNVHTSVTARSLVSVSTFIRSLIPIAVLVSASAAWAADPVFPQGSRVGLAPPAGMVLGKGYAGFEDTAHAAGIIMNEVPAEAHDEIEKSFGPEALKSQGLSFERREEVKSKDWRGVVVVARQDLNGLPVHKWILVATAADAAAVIAMQVPDAAQNVYSEAIVRAALMSTAFRPTPVAERLAFLPYAMSDLAGFRLLQASAEGTALLTEGPKDALTGMDQPFVLISIVLGQTPQPAAYDAFARQIVATIPGVKVARVVNAQALTIGNQPSYEVVAEARHEPSNTDVSFVQWLRFGGTGYLRILGLAPRKAWDAVFPRMRTLRDGIRPK
jgi:hypothetical protein